MTETFFRHKNGLKHINVVDLNIVDNDGFSALFVVNTPIIDNSGVAHGVEHMVFRGSKAFPQPETLFQLTSLTDAKINASTFAQTTYFHCQSLCEHTFLLAINYLLHGLFDPVFNAGDLRCEIYDGGVKGVIYRELLGSELLSVDNPPPEEPTEFHYGGLSASIGELSLHDVRDFHQRFYHANNITLITANADIEQISTLISTLPKSENLFEYNQVELAKQKQKTKESEESEQHQKKYSPTINKLMTLYHLWSQDPFYQQIENFKEIENSEKNVKSNTNISPKPFLSNLISPLATLSNELLSNNLTKESVHKTTSTASKKASLPNLFSKLFVNIAKHLTRNKANCTMNQAYSHDQQNALWVIAIGAKERPLATITSYIISAYPKFLAPRCQGSCYAIQALTVENSAYLAIYSAFDVSPSTRMKEASLSLLELSQNNAFISGCLALAKIKYCRALQLENNQVSIINSTDIANYLLAIANGPHPKV